MHGTNEPSNEAGFTLIELLVVVIIIGILAAIAIPTFINQRQKAWRSTAKADLHNAAIVAEDWYEQNQTYLGLAPAAFKTSDRVVIVVASADTLGYCLDADHQSLGPAVDFHLDSTVGYPATGPC